MGVSLLFYQTPHPKDSHPPPIWCSAMCFIYCTSACVCVKQIITVVHEWESIGRDSESRCQRLYSDKIIWTLPCKWGSGRVGGNTGGIYSRKWVGAKSQKINMRRVCVTSCSGLIRLFLVFVCCPSEKTPTPDSKITLSLCSLAFIFSYPLVSLLINNFLNKLFCLLLSRTMFWCL